MYYEILNKYKNEIDSIINKYNYPNNISHLLYIIIPLFIENYGIGKDRLILNTFSNVYMKISDVSDQVHQAFYTSIPFREDKKIKTRKFIVLKNYSNINLMQLIDNLVHEYNHAVNSYQNEINILNNKIYVRTGLCNIVYDFHTLASLEKEDSYILEEILNTNQTEKIINLINDINVDSILDEQIRNTIIAIKNEYKNNYSSKSYLLQTYICKYILENKTFINTINNLRISGNIENISEWFDNITGINNSYNDLIIYLNKIHKLEREYNKKKIKFFTINKIKDLNIKIITIITTFTNNSITK